MNVDDLVLVQGMRDTRVALARWNTRPWSVLRVWFGGALVVACAAARGLGDRLGVGRRSHDRTAPRAQRRRRHGRRAHDPLPKLAGARPARVRLRGRLHRRQLASALGRAAQRAVALVHEKARPIALGWVVLVTCFSLATQAYALGLTGAQLANQLWISPGVLVLTVLPHAIPELVALFLPLAAWTIASRRDEWGDLLAATFVTVAIAIPILVAAATWEVYVWPHILRIVSPLP